MTRENAMPNTQLTRQIGEHLVVAELGRYGIAATPFAGNMPYYDIVALTQTGRSIYIQVKAINSGDWQLNANHFLVVEYDKASNTQNSDELRPTPVDPLIFVLVKIIESGKDEFYVLSYSEVQQIVKNNYMRTDGKSHHFALRKTFVESYKVEALSYDCITARTAM
jgi:hypothetical protein